MKTFAEILAEKIESNPDLTEAGVALAAGLGDSHIRQMIKFNRSPRIDTAEKICAALGTTLPDFLLENQDPIRTEIVHLLNKLTPDEQNILLSAARGIGDRHRQEET